MPKKGYKQSKKHKERISLSRTGDKSWVRREDIRKKISKTLKDRQFSEKTKEKMSKSKIGHPNYLLKQSPESRMKISNGWNGIENIRTKKVLEKKEKKAGRLRPKNCEICGREGKICFDHCHKTDKFRGWICHNCNAVLGFVNDDYKILEKLINYIKKF